MAITHLLLVGDNARVKEFASVFAEGGATSETAGGNDAALAYLKIADPLPDGIVFIVPVYWEAVGGFVEEVRKDERLAAIPIIYLGDFIEANDQIALKRQGVHTLTLGPVPTPEAARYVLKVVHDQIPRVFEPGQ